MMEMLIVILLGGVVVCCVATLVILVRLSRELRSQDDEERQRRLLSEQTAETMKQIQMVREELTRTLREQLTENRMELSISIINHVKFVLQMYVE